MTEPTPPPVACCEDPHYESQAPCALCEKPTCKRCRSFVNRNRVCPDCRDMIEAELEAEKGGVQRLPVAVMGGVAGALIGGVIWAAIAVVTNYQVGYVALAVGWLAGMGTVMGSGGKKAPSLQVIAVLCSVLGLVLGKYFTLVHFLKTEVVEVAGWSYFDGRFLEIFFENVGEMLDGFDILWLVLAVVIAWRIPAATRVSMSRSR